MNRWKRLILAVASALGMVAASAAQALASGTFP